MSRIRKVAAPEEFEQHVVVRALLSSLPAVNAPPTFEQDLERRLADLPQGRRGFRSALWWWLGVGAIVVGVGVLYVAMTWSQPAIVEVVAVPQHRVVTPLANLENMPPVVVEEDVRWREEVTLNTRRYRRWPRGVPGY